MKYKRRPFSPLLKQKMASGIVEVPRSHSLLFQLTFPLSDDAHNALNPTVCQGIGFLLYLSVPGTARISLNGGDDISGYGFYQAHVRTGSEYDDISGFRLIGTYPDFLLVRISRIGRNITQIAVVLNILNQAVQARLLEAPGDERSAPWSRVSIPEFRAEIRFPVLLSGLGSHFLLCNLHQLGSGSGLLRRQNALAVRLIGGSPGGDCGGNGDFSALLHIILLATYGNQSRRRLHRSGAVSIVI